MNILRHAADVFLIASGFITVYALLLCGATAVLLPADWPMPLAVYGLVGGGTLAAYNYHALVQQHSGSRALLPEAMRRIQRACVTMGGVTIGISLMSLPVVVWMLAAALGVLTMLYSTPMFAFGGKKRLKDFGGLKWLILAVVWTLATTMIPATASGLRLPEVWTMFRDEMIVRTLLLLPLCLAFDIRDVHSDSAAGVRTIPAWLGIKRSEWLVTVLLALFAGVNAFLFHEFLPFAALGVGVALYGWVAARAAVRTGDDAIAYLGWLDGTLALYAAMHIIVAWHSA